ncbi:hypothetical protein EJP77_10310 [Paenibacillus zeisoli]|uniref:Beta-carotene 15,15'-monooxygenase n=1 Tax=Paenibacillus zeisoli TaxID=2496267 RepID=A0A3S1D672_9BACL|nr:hypothetical protein [Paenibacillus zeisoli]RUT31770.1 hypothetical protein EJP77_10310 [Paenibacillus zeisoli]
MMSKLFRNNMSYFIGVSLFIILFDLVVVKSVLAKENDQLLSIGVTLDFVVVIPLLLYFLIYRQRNKKIIAVLPYALIGYIALALTLPHTSQGTLDIVKYTLIPMELTFLCYEIFKIYQIAINFRRNFTAGSHPIETLRRSLEAIFNSSKITSLLVHDASVFYYALLSWGKKPYLRNGTTSFSYHTKSSWLITILILSKVLLIEGACIHLLIMQWSHIAAWVLSLGNIYIIILFIADYRAMCLNPILVSQQDIRLQYGIQMSSYIDIDNIESVSVIKSGGLAQKDLKTSITPLIIEPNVLVRLKSKITVIHLFGKRQIVDQVYLFLDNPREFQEECQNLMEQQQNS